MIRVGDLVKIDATDDELLTFLKAYGEAGVVIDIDKTTAPEMLHIMFSNQILSFYSDSVEVVSHT